MVEAVIPRDAAPEAAAMPEELQILGLWREPLDENLSLLRVLVRSEHTEGILAELESRFNVAPGFRLVIFEVEATVPHPETFDEDGESSSVDEAAKGSDEQDAKEPKRIACAELVERLTGGTKADSVFLVTVGLSTVVASIGLARGNVAILIGAMVIAPLLVPNMTLALATTLGDGALAKHALRVNLIGLGAALLVAAAIGVAVPIDTSLPEVSSRTAAGPSDVLLALAAGSAGALAFTTGLSTALVGVMVAVALLPPLATAGLLAGSGNWTLALQALVLTATNVICINLAGVITFLWQGVQPKHWWEAARARRMVRLAAAVWVSLLLALVGLMVLSNP
jgi:uncharacterized hydrophobic protein (TIGR00341 family)